MDTSQHTPSYLALQIRESQHDAIADASTFVALAGDWRPRVMNEVGGESGSTTSAPVAGQNLVLPDVELISREFSGGSTHGRGTVCVAGVPTSRGA